MYVIVFLLMIILFEYGLTYIHIVFQVHFVFLNTFRNIAAVLTSRKYLAEQKKVCSSHNILVLTVSSRMQTSLCVYVFPRGETLWGCLGPNNVMSCCHVTLSHHVTSRHVIVTLQSHQHIMYRHTCLGLGPSAVQMECRHHSYRWRSGHFVRMSLSLQPIMRQINNDHFHVMTRHSRCGKNNLMRLLTLLGCIFIFTFFEARWQ